VFLKDINGLVGNNLPIQIPDVLVKWITAALAIHIPALVLAALSAVFGLLAHVREMSMTCCSTFVSGFAAFVALVAFIFDLVLFFVAKSRINAIGSASIGIAIWLTLAACLLLFFSGCFYSCGKNCISNRPSKKHYDDNGKDDTRRSSSYNKQRADARRAEKERKARQGGSSKGRQTPEGGLPDMPEIESENVPLTASLEDLPQSGIIDGDQVRIDPPERYRQQSSTGGYVPAARGTTAMDGYYNNRPQNTYPPSNPYPQNSYPTPNAYPPPNAYSPPNAYPPSQLSLPSHTSSVAPSVTPYYGYTSSPITDGCEPAYIPDEHSELTNYLDLPGRGQHPNYNPYGEIRSSPSPHQDSLLDPPRPSAALYSSIPPQENLQSGYTLRDDNLETRRLQLLQPPSNPYIIQPSPSPQQHGNSGSTPGGVDYEAFLNQSTSSQPTAIPYVPAPPPLQNYQSGYTSSGDGNYEVRRPQPPSNPYVIQPSPSPQQRHSGYLPGGADYGFQTPSNQSTSSQRTTIPYVPSPPPQQNDQPMYGGYTPENDNYEARRLQPPSNPYVIHPSPSPRESRQGRDSYIPPGGVRNEKSPDDLPPIYTSIQD
jgi:hypothetical protein